MRHDWSSCRWLWLVLVLFTVTPFGDFGEVRTCHGAPSNLTPRRDSVFLEESLTMSQNAWPKDNVDSAYHYSEDEDDENFFEEGFAEGYIVSENIEELLDIPAEENDRLVDTEDADEWYLLQCLRVPIDLIGSVIQGAFDLPGNMIRSTSNAVKSIIGYGRDQGEPDITDDRKPASKPKHKTAPAKIVRKSSSTDSRKTETSKKSQKKAPAVKPALKAASTKKKETVIKKKQTVKHDPPQPKRPPPAKVPAPSLVQAEKDSKKRAGYERKGQQKSADLCRELASWKKSKTPDKLWNLRNSIRKFYENHDRQDELGTVDNSIKEKNVPTSLNSIPFKFFKDKQGRVIKVEGKVPGHRNYLSLRNDDPRFEQLHQEWNPRRMRAATKMYSDVLATRNDHRLDKPFDYKFDVNKPRYDAGHLIGHRFCTYMFWKQNGKKGMSACDDPLNVVPMNHASTNVAGMAVVEKKLAKLIDAGLDVHVKAIIHYNYEDATFLPSMMDYTLTVGESRKKVSFMARVYNPKIQLPLKEQEAQKKKLKVAVKPGGGGWQDIPFAAAA